MFAAAEDYRKEVWRKTYPTTIGVFLSLFQMILSFVIIGCEVTNMFFHFPRMNLFVGYWTFPLLTCAWISLAGISCCCRIRCCGITTLVFQFLAIPMALSVVGLNVYFLMNPTHCWFLNTCMMNEFWSRTEYYDTTTLYNIKIPIIKGQLAAGGLMVASQAIYIIIFVMTNHKVSQTIQLQNNAPVQIAVMPKRIDYVDSSTRNRTMAPPYNSTMEIPLDSVVSRNQMTCPKCHTNFRISSQHY